MADFTEIADAITGLMHEETERVLRLSDIVGVDIQARIKRLHTIGEGRDLLDRLAAQEPAVRGMLPPPEPAPAAPHG